MLHGKNERDYVAKLGFPSETNRIIKSKTSGHMQDQDHPLILHDVDQLFPCVSFFRRKQFSEIEYIGKTSSEFVVFLRTYISRRR
jgi:hypothetical protein